MLRRGPQVADYTRSDFHSIVANMRILHLEDNPADSLLIERVLKEHGLEPHLIRAGTAEAFRREIAEGAFDVVVLDSDMPGFDGLSALRLSKGVTPRTPVIVCSGCASSDSTSRRSSMSPAQAASRNAARSAGVRARAA